MRRHEQWVVAFTPLTSHARTIVLMNAIGQFGAVYIFLGPQQSEMFGYDTEEEANVIYQNRHLILLTCKADQSDFRISKPFRASDYTCDRCGGVIHIPS
jgi:hypothetical protein